jgi:single-strand DNA-binding protein
MNESYVTVQGWVGNDVEARDVGDVRLTSFRLGSTPRYYKGGAWVDGETSWYTVNCWRGLARNVEESVRRGDAVVVHGRVRVDVWERPDQPTSVRWVVDASFVGHDLTKGTSSFLKAQRAVPSGPVQDEAVREALHATEPTGPKLDSDGDPVEPAA